MIISVWEVPFISYNRSFFSKIWYCDLGQFGISVLLTDLIFIFYHDSTRRQIDAEIALEHQEFAREEERTATLQDGCRRLESRRIDVWRLRGFLDVSSSGIAGLPTPAATLPPLFLALAATALSPCDCLQNKETHVIKFLLKWV